MIYFPTLQNLKRIPSQLLLYLNPTVEDIDEIVPLPPAKLPPWDGKLK